MAKIDRQHTMPRSPGNPGGDGGSWEGNGMSKSCSAAFWGIVLVVAGASAAVAAPELALKRVMLSSGGVAYYEHDAVVDGDTTLSLAVRLDQVDDVLKSIVVYDDTGTVGAIRLPGREPLKQLFRDLPFDQSALASSVELLNALSGAEVEVSGTRAVKGRILSVVEEVARTKESEEIVLRHRVSLMTPDGLQQFVLEDAGDHARLHHSDRFQGAETGSGGELIHERRLAILVGTAGDGFSDELVAAHEEPRQLLLGLEKMVDHLLGDIGGNVLDAHHAAADLAYFAVVETLEDARGRLFAEAKEQHGGPFHSGQAR